MIALYLDFLALAVLWIFWAAFLAWLLLIRKPGARRS